MKSVLGMLMATSIARKRSQLVSLEFEHVFRTVTAVFPVVGRRQSDIQDFVNLPLFEDEKAEWEIFND